MGRLIEGQWVDETIIRSDSKGSYDRLPRTFRDTISQHHDCFKPESGRYHLYVSYACPWATRTLIYRELKHLQDHISVSVVHPDMMADGWIFDQSFPGSTVDHLFGEVFLRSIYLRADPNITTSVTVPVLWDKKLGTIVNNESADIIRIFNSAFNQLTGDSQDFYPQELGPEINELNGKIYETVNNGVYRCGFASTQQAYDDAVGTLFETLDFLEGILSRQKYLIGDSLTEADLRLIPTLLRFDSVYVTHFKCNLRRISDYKYLWNYTKNLYQNEAVRRTTFFDHIKRHYFYSHSMINPFRIIPLGPENLLSSCNH